MHYIPPSSPNATSTQAFAEYAAVDFLPVSDNGSFDLIVVDGRSRVACTTRALELLKPHGGILVLDNAERTNYQPAIDRVPKHWLRYEVSSPVKTTIIWLSCSPGRC